jgi:hypothetical protein
VGEKNHRLSSLILGRSEKKEARGIPNKDEHFKYF